MVDSTSIVLLALAAVVSATAPAPKWYQFAHSDCNDVDVVPQPSCCAARPWGNVTALEACCEHT